jgi:uncharacterized metal-binding protein
MGNRVSPRCTFANSMLVVVFNQGRLIYQETVPFEINTIIDLINALRDNQIDTLICGGISVMDIRQLDQSLDLAIIDNVSGDYDEIMDALKNNRLYPGFGLLPPETAAKVASPLLVGGRGRPVEGESRGHVEGNGISQISTIDIDCLNCEDRICLRGDECYLCSMCSKSDLSAERLRILLSVANVSRGHEGELCRLAELVSFCLTMKYERVGIAFCIDLLKQAEIVAGILRRFVKVLPVCCQVRSGHEKIASMENRTDTVSIQPSGRIPCNPVAQAEILNRAGTDLNVILGLSIGADCLFIQMSKAPVTTLFVKDKSAEDNPICIAYSKNYLADIAERLTRENRSR